MSNLICKADGLNGTISVYEDKVVISRKGLHTVTLGKETDVMISRVQGVSFREAGFSAGYLRILLAGDKPDVAGTDMNPHTIMFKKKNNEDMKKIKDTIYDLVNNALKSDVGTTVINQISSADELKKFKDLLDSGIITQEEFEAKKKELLGL